MHKSLIQKINEFIDEHQLIPDGSSLVIGLSGGPDSIFLLDFLASIKNQKNLPLIAAHLDHQWRAQSADDAAFCAAQCKKYEIPFISSTLAKLPIELTGSKEEMGRKARRYFLETIAQQYKANFIALAHHFDDQIETFFIRLMRGSSLTGLCAMRPRDGNYIRPLLAVRKAEMLARLEKEGISYLLDPSNEHLDYLRNRIRKLVIPALRESDSRFDTNFEKTFHNLQKNEDFLQNLANEELSHCSEDNYLILSQFLKIDPIMQYRMLIKWLIHNKVPFIPSTGLLDEIMRFLQNSNPGQHTFYHKWVIIKENGKASIQVIN